MKKQKNCHHTATDIKTDEKRRAILLSVCGAHIYQLVRSPVSPRKPADKSIEEIDKLIQDHLTPPSLSTDHVPVPGDTIFWKCSEQATLR